MGEVTGYVCTRASLANQEPCRRIVARSPWGWLYIDWGGRWTA